MAVASLGYIVAKTRDLASWSAFATDVLGVMAAPSPRADVLLFRIDDRPFRIWVETGDTDAFVMPGWEFSTGDDMDAALERLRAGGHAVEILDVMSARTRHVSRLARSVDPQGHPFEMFHGRFLDYVPFASPSGVSGFVTGLNGEMGLGHVVLTAPRFEETYAFYKEILGFGDADFGRFYLAGGGPDDKGVGFAFMHAQNARHHSLALGELPESPNGAVHIMLEVNSIDDVGRAYDRARKHGAHISATLGKHVNDKMISFYVRSPSGFDIEYGCQGLQLDPANWVPTTSMAVSDWGHVWAHHKG
ncbi:2,3-dihydroxybiphenyl 1,2-dioxygenase [Acidocella aquatica]|uniref:2,3-dihydroxybiphenyl 1,2-dioxygenase n=1 Tax=Acidocella aquatica TaxID=1922313 RepID=A0ABQ6A401_9PROT|nr:VOC family protein [Acidocella aquatica]GLR66073.1 2,3-dihydroxybiphenyl 1,2-dioxygenase [Acidocella aquatica]